MLLLLVQLIGGCTHISSLRISQDMPQDLPILLEQKEYHRASQLLDKYPSLDTPGQRNTIMTGAMNYEDAAVADALNKESNEDYVAALNTIDSALLKIPDSTLLPAYRKKIDDSRQLRLRFHERSSLLAESQYLVDQQRAYAEREYLRLPGFLDKWGYSRNQKTAETLADKLFDCNRTAIEDLDLETADHCLDMINALDPERDTTTARTALITASKTQQQDRARIARARDARKQRIIRKTNEQRAEELIHSTKIALEANELLQANNMFRKMPVSELNSPEARAVGTRLDQAVKNRVSELIKQGDRHYRADRVGIAITSWSDAQRLEPEDTRINERIARARKVQDRFNELRKKQLN